MQVAVHGAPGVGPKTQTESATHVPAQIAPTSPLGLQNAFGFEIVGLVAEQVRPLLGPP